MQYTYSHWDGSQDVSGVDPDALLGAMSDDLLANGDLTRAIRNAMRTGVDSADLHLPGLAEIVRRVQDERRTELAQYDLDSAMVDIRSRVGEIVAAERDALERLHEQLSSAPGESREQIESVLNKRREALDALSDDLREAVTQLADHEPIDDVARMALDALLEGLQRHVLQRHFHTMEQSIRQLSGDTLQDFKAMLRDLDRQLTCEDLSREADFAAFMQRHGRHVPPSDSFESLLGHMQEQAQAAQTLLNSMTPAMRGELESTLRSVLRDEELGELLSRLTEHVERRSARSGASYPFSGAQTVTLDEALSLMHRMSDLDRLEHALHAALETADLSLVDADEVARLIGPNAAMAVEKLASIRESLLDGGYVDVGESGLELTARGIRRIGARALDEIFHRLGHSTFGEHATGVIGTGADRSDDSKPYEHGDLFLLDMHRTLMNAVGRDGAGTPLKLEVTDFEVYRTEQLSRSATVLMVDMSRSMPLRGCFAAARKVALALNSLIRTQFPRDVLYVIGFSDLAREMRPEELHHVSWDECVYGTNMQHGFMVSRRLLGRHRDGTRQIILITDGEPTAHLEGNRVQFAYPPTFRTFQETLREVQRCTNEGIVINTFMLDRSHYLADFVKKMTRINDGRAFFATPEKLGDYILVDYVRSRRGTPGAAGAGRARRV